MKKDEMVRKAMKLERGNPKREDERRRRKEERRENPEDLKIVR